MIELELNMISSGQRDYISHNSLKEYTQRLKLASSQEGQNLIKELSEEDKYKIELSYTLLMEHIRLVDDLVQDLIEKYKQLISSGEISNEEKQQRYYMRHNTINCNVGLITLIDDKEVYIDCQDFMRMLESIKIEFIKFIKDNKFKEGKEGEEEKESAALITFKEMQKLYSNIWTKKHELN